MALTGSSWVMVSFTNLWKICLQISLQRLRSVRHDGPASLSLSSKHGVDVGFHRELEKFLTCFRKTVAVFLNEAHPVGVAVIFYFGCFPVIYTENARMVLTHPVFVISDVVLVRMLLIPQTYVFARAYELVDPRGFGL